MKSLHQILKPLVRPLIAIQFVIITSIDYILLPILGAFKGIPHTPITGMDFFAAYGVYLSVYSYGRSQEKLQGIEPEDTK